MEQLESNLTAMNKEASKSHATVFHIADHAELDFDVWKLFIVRLFDACRITMHADFGNIEFVQATHRSNLSESCGVGRTVEKIGIHVMRCIQGYS